MKLFLKILFILATIVAGVEVGLCLIFSVHFMDGIYLACATYIVLWWLLCGLLPDYYFTVKLK